MSFYFLIVFSFVSLILRRRITFLNFNTDLDVFFCILLEGPRSPQDLVNDVVFFLNKPPPAVGQCGKDTPQVQEWFSLFLNISTIEG